MGKVSGTLKTGGNAVKYGASQAVKGAASGIHVVAKVLSIFFGFAMFIGSPLLAVLIVAVFFENDFFTSFGEMMRVVRMIFTIIKNEGGKGELLYILIVVTILCFLFNMFLFQVFHKIADGSELVYYDAKKAAKNAKQDIINSSYESAYGGQDARIDALNKSGRFSKR